MPGGIYIREPGVENCAHAEVCEHACRMGCKAYEPRVDRESLLELADEIRGLVENQEIRLFHIVRISDTTLSAIENRIREALGVENG